MPILPSLDGRTFVRADDVVGHTTFFCTEVGGVVSASYSGGCLRRGFLVGARAGSSITFRYAEIYDDLSTSGGNGDAVIEELEDGRLRLVVVRDGDDDGPIAEVLSEFISWGAEQFAPY